MVWTPLLYVDDLTAWCWNRSMWSTFWVHRMTKRVVRVPCRMRSHVRESVWKQRNGQSSWQCLHCSYNSPWYKIESMFAPHTTPHPPHTHRPITLRANESSSAPVAVIKMEQFLHSDATQHLRLWPSLLLFFFPFILAWTAAKSSTMVFSLQNCSGWLLSCRRTSSFLSTAELLQWLRLIA